MAVHYPVEKLVYKIKDLIHEGHKNLKPVLVSCNVLESMISGTFPTTSEVGEIFNLV